MRKGKSFFCIELYLIFIYLFCIIGKVGDWKNHFSPEINDKIDKWIEKNLDRADLKFVSELDVQD